ncbi:MAG: glutaminyl-peptide cyclotransferase [Candidatus Adiutrix sp.]|nr:glutaminyl-peptide cyclotransferase [Candidatus Adiutrix sp.]
MKWLIAVLAATWPALSASAAAPELELQLLNARPHLEAGYTQGLFIRDGRLFESSGLYGRSVFSRRPWAPDRQAGSSIRRPLPPDCFAEGAAWAEGEIYILTWRNQRGFVLDPETLAVRREFSYSGEGWGLTWDGRRLWRSDGSDHLRPHRVGDFAPAGEPLKVHDGEAAVPGLNELEWDSQTGLLLANIYGFDRVAAIDPADGAVKFWLNAAPLRALAVRAGLPAPPDLDTALNGLALDGRSLWLTGKSWPLIFQTAWPPAGFDRPE